MAWTRNHPHEATERAYQSLVPLLPDPWVVDEFVALVAADRRRPIRLLPHDLTTGDATGYALRRRSEDVIVVPAKAVGARRDTIICHELAHIVLGHAPLVTDDIEVLSMLAPNCPPELVARFIPRDGYDTDDERAAETLATRLIARAQTRNHQRTASGELDRLTTRLR
jgi:hypothetical protein